MGKSSRRSSRYEGRSGQTRGGKWANVKLWLLFHGGDTRQKLTKPADRGRLDVLRCLANDCGADVNAKNNNGDTALVKAAYGGHLDVVRFLVDDCGTDVNAKNNNGYTALMSAAYRGHLDVVRFLVDDCGADANATKNNGDTALMSAAYRGHLDVVRFLVDDCGADANATNNNGDTALMSAAYRGHLDVIRFLVDDCGADANATNNNGDTALMKAAYGGRLDVVRFLVNDCGADVNVENINGDTALMSAADKGHFDVVRWLVNDCGADVNAKNRNGGTALMKAVGCGRLDAVRYLVNDCGADVNAKNRNGGTALMKAVGCGRLDAVRYLVNDCGADVNAKANDGQTATRLATDHGYYDITRLLMPFILPESQTSTDDTEKVDSHNTSDPSGSSIISPIEVELGEFSQQGTIGGDFQAKWLDADVVVKVFIPDASHSTLAQQVHAWHQLRHPNVQKLYGVCQAGPAVNFFVCEFASQGSLLQYVESSSPSSGVKPPLLWKYLHGAALGLEYLHERGIVHGDLRCSNILIGSDGLAKLSNFGLAGATKKSRELVWRMCCQDPYNRPSLPSIVSDLERLSIEESVDVCQPDLEPQHSFEDYESCEMTERWLTLQECVNGGNNAEHLWLFNKLKHIHDCFRGSKQNERLRSQFEYLLADVYQTITMTPEETRALRLTSTRATMTSMYSFRWRVNALLKALGESISEDMEVSWLVQRREQVSAFVSGIADIALLLQQLTSVEEKTAVLQTLRTEMETAPGKYTEEQSETIKRAYEEIDNRLKIEGEGNIAHLTPEWFIPWYELVQGKHIADGGFGSVWQAKWLDSDVIVKVVGSADDTSFYDSLLSASFDQKRTEARAMFRREADTWFGFSHPHVVRLFGACHIGRPFFVCEYATHGTLVEYLRKHPDELWTKLFEAALGVQYLHARGFVHGDLKGNNIVIGRDLKAKVIDFGLSSAADSETTSPISGAWHWVAPECLMGAKPTIESDVYSLGMCIVEALRVVAALQTGKPFSRCLPWGGLVDKVAVLYHATNGRMPSRPKCEDDQWELVARMCSKNPEDRLKISTVVDMLERWTNTRTDAKIQDDHVANVTFELSMDSAQKLLRKDTEQHSSVAVLYCDLWDNMKCAYGQIERNTACWTAFHSLVLEAHESTANLGDVKGDLISIAQATMRCYALRRRLSKLCDAYFLTSQASM